MHNSLEHQSSEVYSFSVIFRKSIAPVYVSLARHISPGKLDIIIYGTLKKFEPGRKSEQNFRRY